MNLQNSPSLAERWTAERTQNPALRIRDAATLLGASEAELLATEVGPDVRRLRPEAGSMLPRFKELGRIMSLTRNDAMVHERKGRFESVEVTGPMGLVVGPDIDLRCFLMHWKYAFAVTKSSTRGTLRSIQFFDAHGDAVIKVYLQEEGDLAAWEQLVSDYEDDDQRPGLVIATPAAPAPEKPDAEIDVDGFRAAWSGMTDTHEFFGILRTFGVSRTQALRLAPAGMAEPLGVGAFQACLEAAAAQETPIMVFVGSRGCVQIHTGRVKRLKVLDDWFNVLDPDFNLHAKLPLIASAWRVRKPTEDDIVTSLELFDARGESLALLFGERKPGKPECERWRALVNALD